MVSLRVGFLGGGRVAENHALAVRRHPRTELVVVSDPDAAVRTRWKHRGVRVAPDLGELMAENLDVVYVLSPRGMHAEHATAALEAGCHVLVEKPVGKDVSEVVGVAAAASRASRWCIPGHNAVRLPEMERIHAHVGAGGFGKVLHLRIDELYSLPPEQRHELVSPVDEVLIHPLYTTVHLVGRTEVVQAMATDPLGDGDMHGQVSVTLRLADGGIGRLFLSWVGVDHADSSDTYRLALHGTEGSANFSRRGIVKRVDRRGNVETPQYQEMFDRMTQYVVNACTSSSAPDYRDLQEAADAVALLEAVRRSVQSQATETPKYVELGRHGD